jgi:hypothetical protein
LREASITAGAAEYPFWTGATPSGGFEDGPRRPCNTRVYGAQKRRTSLPRLSILSGIYGQGLAFYATDAKVAPSVHVVGIFSEDPHPPIIYPVALTKTASPAARAFLDFLNGQEAKTIFEKAGFTVR